MQRERWGALKDVYRGEEGRGENEWIRWNDEEEGNERAEMTKWKK